MPGSASLHTHSASVFGPFGNAAPVVETVPAAAQLLRRAAYKRKTVHHFLRRHRQGRAFDHRPGGVSPGRERHKGELRGELAGTMVDIRCHKPACLPGAVRRYVIQNKSVLLTAKEPWCAWYGRPRSLPCSCRPRRIVPPPRRRPFAVSWEQNTVPHR